VVENKDFACRVALVTGGGSGIGGATAKMLAARGATVGILDVVEAAASSVREEIAAAGGDAFILMADVGDDAQMKAALEALDLRAKRLDILVASAGINGTWAPIDDLTPEEFDRTMRINLRGTYLAFHYGAPLLKRSGGGAAVVVSSINGQRVASTAGASCYAASKAAQAAMARSLSLELARDKIRVNTVFPGTTVTGISANTWRRNTEAIRFPVVFPEGDLPLTGKPASPEDIAEAIAFLCSDAARHMTGAEINIDGGQSLIR
jgi:NAD(P)-dependent dehydrogenase (short-subunit alcohol dehydrogenase family)